MDGMTINHIVSIDHGSYGDWFTSETWQELVARTFASNVACISMDSTAVEIRRSDRWLEMPAPRAELGEADRIGNREARTKLR
jgi:hypothetical protein